MNTKSKTPGYCATCGKPTERYYTAKYCWPCMKTANVESALKSHSKYKKVHKKKPS